MPPWDDRYSGVSNAAGASARRVFVSIGRQPNIFARILVFALAAVVFGLLLVLIVPIMVIGAVGLATLWLYAWARARLGRARAPNGPLDQRRNVRVIERRD
jgi:hypothetical protein